MDDQKEGGADKKEIIRQINEIIPIATIPKPPRTNALNRLIDWFRGLSPAGKYTVSFIGIAAVVGFIAALFSIPNSIMDWKLKGSELFGKAKPSEVFLSEAGKLELQSVVTRSIENAKKPEASDTFAVSYPGLSIHLLMRLGTPHTQRDNFIIDSGGSVNSNRASVYLDPNLNLCFRVIDRESQPFAVKVAPALDTFTVGNIIYVRCDFGTTQDFSFVRILINGKEVAEKHQNAFVGIDGLFSDPEYVLGADINNQNSSVVEIAEIRVYMEALATTNAIRVIRAIGDRIKPDMAWIAFYGTNSLMRLHSSPIGQTFPPILRRYTN